MKYYLLNMKYYLLSVIIIVLVRSMQCENLGNYTEINTNLEMISSDKNLQELYNTADLVSRNAIDELEKMVRNGTYFIKGLPFDGFSLKSGPVEEAKYVGYSVAGLDSEGLIKQYVVISLPVQFYKSYLDDEDYRQKSAFNCDIIATAYIDGNFKLNYVKAYNEKSKILN
eukprot:TRINITY_DN43041_c0_g2_i5.p4 TRINITY_DN43041_c0_g2~~TRINITY_DN43041_c0_g2_i5.p4  ORF type:complete len:170 (+),score=17.93 TRINITY_DN43041_c0_g2_i5:456-965(+)